MKILGNCFGVEILEREYDQYSFGHPLIQILSEDDGNWFESGGAFDFAWLDDLIQVLTQAKAIAKAQEAPDDPRN